MKSASTPPRKDNLRNIPNFYQAQFKRMDNIRLHLGKKITKENLDGIQADAVILATGAVPIVPGIPGLRENAKVVTANDVLAYGAPVNGKVVIAGGGQVGVETAHYLAEKGYDVTIVEMMPELSVDGELMTKLTLHPILEKVGVKSFVSHRILRINESSVTVLDMAENREFDIAFDTLIILMSRKICRPSFRKSPQSASRNLTSGKSQRSRV